MKILFTPNCLGLLLLLGWCWQPGETSTSCLRVDSLSPQDVGAEGGAAVTVLGCGFVHSSFQLNGEDPNNGNHVYLKNDWQILNTEMIEEGENILKFAPPRGAEGRYEVIIMVNGVTLKSSQCPPWRCRIWLKNSLSPIVRAIEPRYGPPGTIVELNGTIFTSRFTSNLDVFTVGRPQSIIRIYNGGGSCDPQYPNSDLYYGIALVPEDSDTGYLQCRLGGSTIGNQNVTFVVESPFGKSWTDKNVYQVGRGDRPFMFQTYTTLTSIAPNRSSIFGGAKITIHGSHFKQAKAPLVYYDQLECPVTAVEDKRIECQLPITPALPSARVYAGGRGGYWEEWSGLSASDTASLVALDFSNLSSGASKQDFTTEEAKVTFLLQSTSGDSVLRMHSMFIPPRNSLYQFELSTPGTMAFLAGSTTANLTNMPLNRQKTSSIDLIKDQPYELDFRMIANSDSTNMELCVRIFDTNISNGQLDSSHAELQRITFSVPLKKEMQEIDHSALIGQNIDGISEVQTVQIKKAVESFKLCIFNSCTPKISFTKVSQSDIKTYMKEQMHTTQMSVSIDEKTADNLVFTITFPDDFGDLPLLEVRTIPDVSNAAKVSMITKGMTALKGAIRPSYLGHPSLLTYPVDGTEEEVKAAYMSLRETICPTRLTTVNTNKYVFFEDFESDDSGRRTNAVPAFCGYYSRNRPYWYNLPKTVDLIRHPHLCFAVMGKVHDLIRVTYSARGFKVRKTRNGQNFAVNMNYAPDNTWRFKCVNVLSALQDHLGSEYSIFQLHSFYVYPRREYWETTDDYYIDSIFIGSEPIHTDDEDVSTWPRLPSVNFSDVAVTKLTDPGQYQLTLTALNCEYNYDLFGIAGVRNPTDTQPVDVASFVRDSRWPGGVKSSVTRKQKAMVPPSGTITLSFMGVTMSPVKINSVENAVIERALETHPLISEVKVRRYGTCSNLKFNVYFVSNAGDQPLLEVYDKSNLLGDEVAVTIEEIEKGYLELCPIPGDMLAKVEEQPQVRVYLNDIPTACASSCSHALDSAEQPTITAVSFTGSSSYNLLITGTLFDDQDPEMNELHWFVNETVTEVIRAITATSTELTFYNLSLTNIKAGAQTGRLRVAGRGFSETMNFDLSTQEATITSITPNSGPLGGNMTVKIVGTRFDPHTLQVRIGNGLCLVKSATTESIYCLVPESNTAGAVAVSVEQLGITISGSSTFTYDSSITPTISSIQPNEGIPLEGGVSITVDGQNFPNNCSVSIGDVIVMNFTTQTTSQLVFDAPRQFAPGNYPILVWIPSGGRSDSSISLNYVFEVSNVSDNAGSWMGGKTILVDGDGFSQSTEVLLTALPESNYSCLGPREAHCEPIQTTAKQIECRLKPMTRIHKVTNNGVNPRYGPNYAWNPATLVIMQGDTVKWEWTSALSNKPISIYQVKSIDEPIAVTDGFNIGASENGRFSMEFSRRGIYYYASGSGFVMLGAVRVLPFGDCVTRIVVREGEVEAVHNKSETHSMLTRNLTCPGPTECTPLAEPQLTNNSYLFAMRACLTPIVEGFTPRDGSATDNITIDIRGLANCRPLLETHMDRAQCNLLQTSTSSNQLECQIGEQNAINTKLRAGDPLRLDLVHREMGSALVTGGFDPLERVFFFWPQISPDNVVQTGSILGGGELTVTGSGFEVDRLTHVQVSLGTSNYPCIPTAVTAGQITCLITQIDPNVLSSSSPTRADIDMQVFNSQSLQWIPVRCPSSQVCSYIFDIQNTPRVESVQPQEVNNSAVTLTLTGQRLLLKNETAEMLKISVGGIPCTQVTDIGSGNSVTCVPTEPLPYGLHNVTVTNQVRGMATITDNSTVHSSIQVDAVTPNNGSFAGGTMIRLTGHGLDAANIEIYLGNYLCLIDEKTKRDSDRLCCMTPDAQTTGQNTAVVNVLASVPQSSESSQLTNGFTYTMDRTPSVSSATIQVITNANGTKTSEITVAGTLLTGDQTGAVNVQLGSNTPCRVTNQNANEVVCTSDNLVMGSYPINLVTPGFGQALSTEQVNVSLQLDSINPTSGGLLGGQMVTFHGTGFAGNQSHVTVCDQPCERVEGTSLSLVCKTPKSNSTTDKVCDVMVTVSAHGSNKSVSLSNAFTYLNAWTPTVTGVEPLIGGTAGGTIVSITGNQLDATNGTTVEIGGAACTIQSQNSTTIVCRTNPRVPAGKFPVEVNVGNKGRSTGIFHYYYIDRWSSRFTWNNNPVPIEDDFIVIGANQQIMLDQDTPVLSMVLIDGGMLFFDSTKDVELKSKYIIILNGGKLQIGTGEEPHLTRATVTLHGHVREKELPLFGSKVLALRNGSLELHGMPRAVTWTRLAQPVEVGSRTVELTHPVDWKAGEKVVITTTGGRSAHGENEVHEIESISADGRTLTLVSGMKYRKISTTIEYTNDVSGFFTAEIGLLTRNVVIRGNSNSAVPNSVPECPADFSTGQFATQTCYQGNPEDQMGIDQHGGHMHIGGPVIDSNTVQAHISYTEFTYMGQAFRLGRYPIHFHLNGRMNGTYVKGCSIHHTFNRAVNIHNTHEVLVENNVVYDVMGGALFLEDGIEQGNVIQYNLFVYVKKTNSLLNDDVVPAAYWITHPNNTVQHNVAAGGTNFGFWYRMLEHPNGPSTTTTVCPRIAPLGVFENNTVHSQGWFALWIHEDFFPTKTGKCGSTDWNKAVFRKMFAWNNNKGPECVNCGGVQFEDMLLVNNVEAAVEGKVLENGNLYDPETGPLYKNMYVVAHEDRLTPTGEACQSRAVILPWSPGLRIEDMILRNFNGFNCTAFHGTVITCQCNALCGGYEYRVRNLTWENTTNRAEFRWASDMMFRDEDSSLVAGISGVLPMDGALIMPFAPHLPKDKCGPSAPDAGDLGQAFGQGQVHGVRCLPEVTGIRYSVDKVEPSQATGSNMTVTFKDGDTQDVPYKSEGLTESKGWMTVLVNNHTFEVGWRELPAFTNLSYVGHLENFREGDYVIIRHVGFAKKPDRVKIFDDSEETVSSTEPLDPAVNASGDVYYNETGQYIEYLVKCPENPASFVSIKLSFKAYVCFFPKCGTPEDVVTGDTGARPVDAVFWSDPATWDGDLGPLPTDGNSLTIPKGTWLVLDTSVELILETIRIEGTLEIISGTADSPKNYDISFKQMLLYGGSLLAGIKPEEPLVNANLKFTLLGSITDSDQFVSLSGPSIGPKSIAVYGQMVMHADRKIPSWTRLRETAAAGTNTLVLSEAVTNWTTGDRIVVATTSQDFKQSEVHTIQSISTDRQTITLDDSLQHAHIAYNEEYGAYQFQTAAEVAILSSNIIIHGDSTSESRGFGGRVLVSVTLVGDDFVVGQLKLSGVHFRDMGQSTFLSETDARFPVAFLSAGNLQYNSYIKSTIFENSFSTAIGAFGTSSLEIKDTVIYKTKGSGISLNGYGHKLTDTVIMQVGWSGNSASGATLQSANVVFQAGVDILNAPDSILQGIAVAGAERIGMITKGFICTENVDLHWQDVVLHSCMIGLVATEARESCNKIANIKVYSASEFSVYWRVKTSIQGTNLQLVDNRGGTYTFVGLPDGRSAQLHDKTVQLENSLIVGRSGLQPCTDAPLVEVIKASNKLRGIYSPNGGHVGMISAQFASSLGDIIKMGFVDWSSDFSLGGGALVRNITVANFGTSCASKKDFFWRTDTANEDGIQPTFFEGITAINLENDYLVYYDRPKLGNVNFEKCGDMECDGHKKVLVMDKDGTLFGQPTTILPQSEWQWNGNSAYGVGTNRVPKRMTTHPDGTTFSLDSQWPQKGVIRDDSCQYVATMQAYKCGTALDHRVMLIESVDEDRITRRVAPIAFATDGLQTNYVDLINGPADHGRCSSYACMKRNSAFFAFVARDKNFKLYFTGTPPQNIRLRILQADATYGVRLGIDYSIAGRLDIFADGQYVMPLNGEYNDKNQLIYTAPSSPGEYMPDPTTDARGTSYFDETEEMLYVVIKGTSVIEIRLKQLIKVAFGLPAMTADEFFGSKVVDNLAAFLGVPSSRIRIVSVVAEDSGGSRRRRATSGVQVSLEISEPVETTISSVNGSTPRANETKTAAPSVMENAAANLVNSVQSGALGSVLNASVADVQVLEPVPLPSSPLWSAITLDPSEMTNAPQIIQIPISIESTVNATVVEGEPFVIVLSTTDAANKHVSKLGSPVGQWKYNLSDDQQPDLFVPIQEAPFPVTNDGYAVVDQQFVNSAGRLNLVASIADPKVTRVLTKTIDFTVNMRQFEIVTRLLKMVNVTDPQSGTTTIIPMFRIQLFDRSTGKLSERLNWGNFTWKLAAGLCSGTNTSQMSETVVNPLRADYYWNGSAVSATGTYTFCFRMNAYQNEQSSTPLADYSPSLVSIPLQVSGEPQETSYSEVVRLKFPGKLADISNKIDQFKSALESKLLSLYSEVTVANITLTEGSIVADVTLSSTSQNSLLEAEVAIQKSVNDGTMTITVNGTQFTAQTVTAGPLSPSQAHCLRVVWKLTALMLMKWIFV